MAASVDDNLTTGPALPTKDQSPLADDNGVATDAEPPLAAPTGVRSVRLRLRGESWSRAYDPPVPPLDESRFARWGGTGSGDAAARVGLSGVLAERSSEVVEMPNPKPDESDVGSANVEGVGKRRWLLDGWTRAAVSASATEDCEGEVKTRPLLTRGWTCRSTARSKPDWEFR